MDFFPYIFGNHQPSEELKRQFFMFHFTEIKWLIEIYDKNPWWIVYFTELYGTANLSQPAVACLKLTMETLEQGVKYVKS